MSHARFEELVVSYVMDENLTDDVQRELIPHLASCAGCGDLFRSLQATTADLAFAAPAATPPTGLEDRIIDAVRADGLRVAPVRRSRSWVMLVAASVAFLVTGAVGGTLVSSLQTARDEQSRSAMALQMVQHPQALIARLGAGDSPATGVVAVKPSGEGVLIVSGLQASPDGFVHELWLIRDGVPVPAEVFKVSNSDGNTIVSFSVLQRNFDAAAITLEKGPRGSPKPTSDVLLSGPSTKST